MQTNCDKIDFGFVFLDYTWNDGSKRHSIIKLIKKFSLPVSTDCPIAGEQDIGEKKERSAVNERFLIEGMDECVYYCE